MLRAGEEISRRNKAQNPVQTPDHAENERSRFTVSTTGHEDPDDGLRAGRQKTRLHRFNRVICVNRFNLGKSIYSTNPFIVEGDVFGILAGCGHRLWK